MVQVRESIPLLDTSPDVPASKQHDVGGLKLASSGAAGTTDIDLPTWFERIKTDANLTSVDAISQACELVTQRLHTQTNYRSNALETGVGMADILSYLSVDAEVLTAAILFRAVRESLITPKEVLYRFGEEVARLIHDSLSMGRLADTIEKSKQLEDHFDSEQKDHLAGIYKMLIAVTNDVRVVLIKLAERTFALRELSAASDERKVRVAREIMMIYAPLAHRLGIAQLKWELEDLAFRYIAPEQYKEIARLLSEKRTEREAYIERAIGALEQALRKQGMDAEVSGRVKHIYSIYKKMKRKQLSFDQLYDIRALRVLVHSPSDCYQVLGVVHSLWRFIPDQFDDYITNPKPNGYRSLHTAVIAEHKSLEVQIRTHEMHFEAELGVCAHVNYKEGTKNKKDAFFDAKLHTLRQVLARYQDKQESTEDDDEDVQLQEWSELERIYVFTRDGDIQELPKGSTVLDFAYHVHTQVGNQCAGARVNNKFVPLTYALKTGEQVEIVTRKGREPNRDWLVSSLGYIQSSRARSKLKHWFNQQDRGKNVQIGRDMLTAELARLGLHEGSVDLDDYISDFRVQSADDILVALVTGDIQLSALTERINDHLDLQPSPKLQDLVPSIHPRATGSLDAFKVEVDGIDNIEIHFAKCCYPLHGEPIVGFITKQNGVSIHHESCPEYARLIKSQPDRRIAATWYAQNQTHQLVLIAIEAYDRRGLLKDLTQVIDKEHVNILQVNTLSEVGGFAKMTLKIEISGLSQLSRLLAKLEQQPGIISARRYKAS